MVTAQRAREVTNAFRDKFEYAPYPKLGRILDAITELADNGFNSLFIAPTTITPVLDTLRGLGYTITHRECYIEIVW